MHTCIWFIGPTDCFTNRIRSLRCMKLRCSLPFTEEELMHRKVTWIGGAAEREIQTSCVTLQSPTTPEASLCLFIPNQLQTHGDFQVHTPLPPYLPNSILTMQTARLMTAGKQMMSRKFFFFPHYHTQNYSSLTSLYPGLCTFISVHCNLKWESQSAQLPDASDYDSISTRRPAETLTRLSLDCKASRWRWHRQAR